MRISAITICAVLSATQIAAGQIGSGGVSAIKKNGSIAGNPSYSIRCTSGSGVVIRKGRSWTDSSGYTYSDRLWGLSLEELAEKLCE